MRPDDLEQTEAAAKESRNGFVTRIENVAPTFRDIVLPGLHIRVRCEAMNRIEMLRRERLLPGLLPPADGEDAGPAVDPAAAERNVYPAFIVGCFMLGEDGEPIRPTFSIEPEAGRISLRRVPEGDLVLMANALRELGGWSGGPVDSAGFPDDRGVRTDGVGTVDAGRQ